jgi:hypothetical protein
MSWTIRTAILFLFIFLEIRSVVAQGVSSVPVVTGVFPPSATVGQTTDWTISGRNFKKVKTLLVSGQGVEIVEFLIKEDNTATAKVRILDHADPGVREVRLDGPTGVSNLALVRVDRLKSILEVEPNDSRHHAQPVEPGTAVIGVLKALDLDHYRIQGKPGQKLTIDLEARRIGTSIAPVVTIFASNGAALAQGRQSRGPDEDCVMSIVLPADGICVVQVRDNTYGGNDQARYRLRIDPAPFATGLFPIGGPRGQTVEFEVSGGNLDHPLRKSITLPDSPGLMIEPGSIEGPEGLVAIPGRIVVGEGPEIVEPQGRLATERSAIEVKAGTVVNGRISQPGEVDSYRLALKKGEKLRFRIEAAAMGSWLDSVIAIRDAKGATLAENDDSNEAVRPNQARSVSALGVPTGSPDSALEFEAKDDGIVTIEVADRFGDGGPEYPYRLAIGADRPDFALTLLLGNATANAQALNNIGQVRTPRTSPGQFGVFNLRPGSSIAVNFIVAPEGKPGPIEIRAEGLPEGVTAEPVRIRFPGPSSTTNTRVEPVADFLQLKVASTAQPGLSELRFVARATPSPGVVIIREASATIGVDASAVSGRPITRVVSRVPFRITGEPRPRFVGPPAPPRLREVTVPGVLLQGDQLDLKLDFDGTVTADDGSVVEAVAEGFGLATNTVISSGTTQVDDEPVPNVTIHVLASIKAQLGRHRVKVSYTPAGGPRSTKEVMVEVKAPIEVRPAPGTIFLKPGDQANFQVEVKREEGFQGEVELKLEGLPRGVKPPKLIELASGVSMIDVRLEMNAEAKPIAKPTELRVVGMARMPRGNVSVESQIRPMIEPRLADK